MRVIDIEYPTPIEECDRICDNIDVFVTLENNISYTLTVGTLEWVKDMVSKNHYMPAGAPDLIVDVLDYVTIARAIEEYAEGDAYWLKVYGLSAGDSLDEAGWIAAFDPDQTDTKGRTNMQRMSKGLAPLDNINYKAVSLYHIDPFDKETVLEMSSFDYEHKKYILKHSDTEQIQGVSDRRANRKEAARQTRKYWKNRAVYLREFFKGAGS